MDGVGMSLLDTIIWTSFGTSAESAIQATDPRDRIYGLLGMVRESDRRRIPVDYSPEMTINKVLFAVAKALLEDHGPDILSFCQQPTSHPSKDLPSWVPDFTAPRTMAQIGGVSLGTDSEARPGGGDASGGANWRDWAPKSRVQDVVYEHPVVSLPGIIVAQVEMVGREFSTAPGSASYLDDCRDWLLEINDMVNKSPDKSENVDFDKETWRVPVADPGHAQGDAEGPARFMHGFDVLTGRVLPPPELDSDGAKRDWIKSESWDYRRVWKVYGRRAFVDNSGRPGLGPGGMVVGDKVVVLAGGHVPFILRLDAGTGTHRLMGPACILGLMDGEGVSDSSSFHEIQVV
jgi:hypothetical protein